MGSIYVTILFFSRNQESTNSKIVSCAFGNNIKIWDTLTGKMINEGYLEVGDTQLISFVLS
ncbi:MAG: hypothetical protein KGD61_10790, partial [Candidatus Lokiarchaeota archaeon]|nr:hypothetical protein [Candidatus Lokiarchaeota archaeon]